MIEMFKIATGLYDSDITDNLLKFTQSSTRGHSYKLFKPHTRLEMRKHSFFIRTIEPWNSLHQHVVEATSMNSFKNKLDKHWTKINLLYDYKASQSIAHAIQLKNVKALVTEANQAC